MLALQNTRLSGFMLTGNRSMFLDTERSVGWLYHCSKEISTPKILEDCIDRIPIYYKGQTLSVDPITRQNFPFTKKLHCVGGYKNAFQLDLGNKRKYCDRNIVMEIL